MKKTNINFVLDNNNKLVLQAPELLKNITCCTDGVITFAIHDIEYKFEIHDIQAHMESFSLVLNKALKNELRLHESINQDIGYLWNEAYRDTPGLIYEQKGKVAIWVGNQFRILSSKEEQNFLSAWIYNAPDESIILEITPDYPWDFEDAEKDPRYAPYKEWIKTYKPYVVRTIPKDIAEQWLQQAKDILKTINENIARNLAEETEHHE